MPFFQEFHSFFKGVDSVSFDLSGDQQVGGVAPLACDLMISQCFYFGQELLPGVYNGGWRGQHIERLL